MRTLLVGLALAAGTARAQPQVVAAAPAPHTIAAPAAAPVTLTFSEALDPETVTPATVRVFGRWSGPAAGALALEADGTRVRFTPAAPFSAGEAVTVRVSRGS
ncbi:MAG: Ig-like domain-containing protein, partial [Rhodothermales bacterium]|nr:Ig-like domain-containing protein [Rhodothermales bacterium]